MYKMLQTTQNAKQQLKLSTEGGRSINDSYIWTIPTKKLYNIKNY